MSPKPVGVLELLLNSPHMINIQGRELHLSGFLCYVFFVLFCAQSTFNIGMACVGTLVNDLFQTCNYTRLSSTVEHIFSLNDLDLQ